MRCISCGAEIPAQWVKAIESNECPGCGGQIMTDDSKIILQELSAAIGKMPNDPQGLAGWIMSNYRIKKIGDGEPVERFHRKGGSSKGRGRARDYEDEDDYDEYDEDASEFQRRAGVSKDQQAALREAARRAREKAAIFKKRGSAELDEDDELDEGDEEGYDEEYLSRILAEDVGAFHGVKHKATRAAPESMPTSSLGEMLSGGVFNYDNDIAPVDRFTGAAKATVGLNDSAISEAEAKLIAVAGEEGRHFVEKTRYNRIKAQDAITGGGGGSFRRSG